MGKFKKVHYNRNARDREMIRCPVRDCDGSGHVSGIFATHRSLSGCPRADRSQLQHHSQELKCPTLGCDGSGHITGNYSSHRTLSGCPRAYKPKSKPRDGEDSEPIRASGCPIAVAGPSSAVKFNGMNRPTPGYDGSDHMNWSFQAHRSLSGRSVAGAEAQATIKPEHDDVTPLSAAHYTDTDINMQSDNVEDIETVIQDIINLKRDNELLEAKISQLKADIETLEARSKEMERINRLRARRIQKNNDYAEKLRKEIIALLQNVTIPGDIAVPDTTAIGTLDDVPSTSAIGVRPTPDNFEWYMAKMEQLFSLDTDEYKELFKTIENAFENFTVPPMPNFHCSDDGLDSQ